MDEQRRSRDRPEPLYTGRGRWNVSQFVRDPDSGSYKTRRPFPGAERFDLKAILAILSRDPSPKAIELLAAGPLEDLLVEKGPLVIDEIERQAQSDSSVAMLLGGDWQSEMDLGVCIELADGLEDAG